MVVEDEKQLDKVLAIRSELPHLKAIVQYLGVPKKEGVLSWEELLQIGVKEGDEELEERLKRIAINQCCGLIYTSGTTGLPKVSSAFIDFGVQIESCRDHKNLLRCRV